MGWKTCERGNNPKEDIRTIIRFRDPWKFYVYKICDYRKDEDKWYHRSCADTPFELPEGSEWNDMFFLTAERAKFYDEQEKKESGKDGLQELQHGDGAEKSLRKRRSRSKDSQTFASL